MKLIYLSLSLSLSLSLMLIASCSQINKKHSHSNKAIFKYNEADGISRLDPAYVTRFSIFLVNEHLFSGLITLDKDMNIVPDIAKSWEISQDGKEYTFHLREDVLFHQNECFTENNQRKVNARDVVFSFSRVFQSR